MATKQAPSSGADLTVTDAASLLWIAAFLPLVFRHCHTQSPDQGSHPGGVSDKIGDLIHPQTGKECLDKLSFLTVKVGKEVCSQKE